MYKIAVLNYIELHWNMNYIAVSLKLIQHCKLTIHQLKKEKSSLQVQVAQSHPAESVQLFSRIQLFVAPRTAARQTSLSITNSQSLLKLMSMESVVPSNHLILCHPLLLRLQAFPASGSFLMSQFFTSGGQSIGASASASVLPMNIQDWFPLGWTGWISLQSKGLSRVFSNITIQKHQFLGSSLGKTLLAFALLHFVLQGQTCLIQVSRECSGHSKHVYRA